MSRVIRKPLRYWRSKGFDELVAVGFAEHGRCSSCGWFGGHCSHTATLNTATGQYESSKQESLFGGPAS
jgi:hypothetical protein